jgi:hypothetical protein
MAGVAHGDQASRKAGHSPLHDELRATRIAELKSRIGTGGVQEALVRSLIYVGMTRGSVDERGFEMIRQIRRARGDDALTLSQFKTLVREQFFMLLIDKEAAMAAVPSLLPDDSEICAQALAILKRVLNVSGEITGETRTRLDEVTRLFDHGEWPRLAAASAASAAKKAS